MLGVVGRVKRTPRFDARGLDCFTLFAMTGGEGLEKVKH